VHGTPLRRPAPGQMVRRPGWVLFGKLGGGAGPLRQRLGPKIMRPLVNGSLYKIDHFQGQDTAYGGRAGESVQRGRFGIVSGRQGRFMRGGRAVSGLTHVRSSPEGTSATRGNVRHAIK
jgi:hypothetical protein